MKDQVHTCIIHLLCWTRLLLLENHTLDEITQLISGSFVHIWYLKVAYVQVADVLIFTLAVWLGDKTEIPSWNWRYNQLTRKKQYIFPIFNETILL